MKNNGRVSWYRGIGVRAAAVIVLSFILSAYASGYDSEGRRDPFVPLVDEQGLRKDLYQSSDAMALPVKLHIMGILWSEDAPMAIINGEVVKEGDIIEDMLVEKIEKDAVSINYQNKVYKLLLREEDVEQ